MGPIIFKDYVKNDNRNETEVTQILCGGQIQLSSLQIFLYDIQTYG